MSQATITSKGQVTIPAIVRNAMKVGAGDKLEFIELTDGRYEVIAVTREVKTLKGFLKSNKTVSIEEMNSAISEAASK
ncbi:AbrB family transcriptional regulator [Arsukibacterium sp. MJ3]|jgi:AbrB family looped-hinge helix DNA binding protein|uniref:AbrB/MazE/SpoVT family DNA-binding domain-containing protein n=1 Tax=Arsukibacterium sp. MJ3 TaxID=1632859 RepID=UPI0006270517|nr:AbrB/MazE/SpoVT family DNA-binding domain-containing protein [Arsukibacterium sp. MJ3]KKO47633.1 AbrB family transcriptional regulator [Arsukibacterium sp. MJ3]